MPICVFDISEDGSATVPDTRTLTGPARYRWWHFDLADPALADWCETHLPAIPAGALLQPETRPRCDAYEDGLILNLRGINLNAGLAAEDLVSIRLWVTDSAVVTVRLRRVFAIEEIRQSAAAQMAPPTPAGFVTALVTRLTTRVQAEVMAIAKLTEFFEADLEEQSTPIPTELPLTRRRVIRMRRYLDPQRAALDTLASSSRFTITRPCESWPTARQWRSRNLMRSATVSMRCRMTMIWMSPANRRATAFCCLWGPVSSCRSVF
jgi:zinc transporter